MPRKMLEDKSGWKLHLELAIFAAKVWLMLKKSISLSLLCYLKTMTILILFDQELNSFIQETFEDIFYIFLPTRLLEANHALDHGSLDVRKKTEVNSE